MAESVCIDAVTSSPNDEPAAVSSALSELPRLVGLCRLPQTKRVVAYRVISARAARISRASSGEDAAP